MQRFTTRPVSLPTMTPLSTTQRLQPDARDGVDKRRIRPAIRLSIAAAVLAFVGSIVGLADARIYRDLTAAFYPQAIAQDIANLAIAPLIAVSAVWALRGSRRAFVVWLGAVAFTVYNYVIYAFSVPFGPLFPVWCAVLGLSLFALILGLRGLEGQGGLHRYASPRMATIAAWVLLVSAGLFGLLWLSEDIPALVSGTTPASALELSVPTNAVHVLDYVFFLPAALLTGIGLLRREPFSHAATPAYLLFLSLTCVPILITPFVQGSVMESIGLMAVVGLLTLILVTVLFMVVRSIAPDRRFPRPGTQPRPRGLRL